MLSKLTKQKILFLWLDDTQFHAEKAKENGVHVTNVYRKLSTPLKILNRIQIKINMFSIHPWLESWANELERYDTVILHASRITPPVVRYIKNKRPEIRVIVWYWNPVIKNAKLNSFISQECEVWTFDEDDARIHNLYYNTQYYFRDSILEEKEKNNDVLFVGTDKGRLSSLLKIKSELDVLNIKSNFHIVSTSKKIESDYAYNKKISYASILNKISESKALLDIVSEKQTGLTLRPLEALYFKRKLITSDKSIIKRDFYSPQNVFVIGHDDMSSLSDFINSPLVEVGEEILKKYDFESWLSRFFQPKSN